MPFCWPSCSLLFCLQLFSFSHLFLYRLVVWGWVLGLIGCQSPSPGFALPIFFNNKKRSFPVGYFSILLQVVTTECCGRFSTGRLLTVEDFRGLFCRNLSYGIYKFSFMMSKSVTKTPYLLKSGEIITAIFHRETHAQLRH